MKKLLVFVFLIVSQIGYAYASNNEVIVENSLGRLLLLHDKIYSYQEDVNPFGSVELYKEFLKIYNEKIKDLPEMYRVNYFWASMWHLDFDGHSMAEFKSLVMQDCGEQFIVRLQQYIDEESELKRDKSRLYLSEKVLAGLKLIRDKPMK